MKLFRVILGLAALCATPAYAQLKYPAPTLVNPETIQLGTGLTVTKMDPAKDYIIKCPATVKKGSTVLQGGRNYVVIGCHTTLPKGDSQQRNFYVNGHTGIAHFEGIQIDYSGGEQGDAFAINAPNGIVQIQRTRVDGVLGTQSLFHGDIIQPWGGVKELRVDRFTGSSYYQGFQLPAMDGKPKTGPVLISRTNLTSLGTSTKESGGFLAWFIQGTEHCDVVIPATLSDFYVKPRADRTGADVIWPQSSNHPCATRFANGEVSFPKQPTISGVVKVGAPAVDFAPAGSVGLAYDPAAAVWMEKVAAPAPVPVPTPAPVVTAPAPAAPTIKAKLACTVTGTTDKFAIFCE